MPRSGSDSRSDFRDALSRKVKTVVERSEARPGRFLMSGLQEMAKTLQYRGGARIEWSRQRVTPWASQVLFAEHPKQSMAMRSAREVATL
eukprot:4629633-Lingulodinium_polyedra.AAC.1